MSKDYAHRRSVKKPKKRVRKPVKGNGMIRRFFKRLILLMILFALLFAFVTTVVKNRQLFFKLMPTHSSKKHSSKHIAKPVVKKAIVKKEEQKPTENKVNFEFYKMLPRISVEVYNDQESTQHSVMKKRVKAKSAFVLQLASIQDVNEAAAFKEKLSELGYHARIIDIQRGDITWHRVQLGPYKDLKSAEKASDQLLTQGINSILLRLSDNSANRTLPQ